MRGARRRQDWLGSTWRGPYRLLGGAPLVAAVNSWQGPAPLQVDIHDGLEVGIELLGTAERHFEDHIVPGAPGDVWLSSMWEPHGRRVLSPRCENVVVAFSPEFLGEEMVGSWPWLSMFAAPASQRPSVASEDMRGRVLGIGEELRYEISRQPPAWADSVRLLVLRLLLVLGREWRPPLPAARARRSRVGAIARIMPALTAVRVRRDHHLSLVEAAAACNLSRAHFAVLFREGMGVTFGRFCLRLRLGIVAHQLLTTDRTVEDLACRYGFVDSSHLHRLFVRHYGCTPGQYRLRGC